MGVVGGVVLLAPFGGVVRRHAFPERNVAPNLGPEGLRGQGQGVGEVEIVEVTLDGHALDAGVLDPCQQAVQVVVAAVGQVVVFAEDAVDVVYVPAVECEVLNGLALHPEAVHGLMVLPEGHRADETVEGRLAVEDLLAAVTQGGAGQAIELKVGLVDLGALGIQDDRVFGLVVGAAVVVRLAADGRDVLHLGQGAKAADFGGAVGEARP